MRDGMRDAMHFCVRCDALTEVFKDLRDERRPRARLHEIVSRFESAMARAFRDPWTDAMDESLRILIASYVAFDSAVGGGDKIGTHFFLNAAAFDRALLVSQAIALTRYVRNDGRRTAATVLCAGLGPKVDPLRLDHLFERCGSILLRAGITK